MSIVAREQDRLKPWEMSWNGRHWQDMPGSDHEIKKMNFYLFRTGRLEWDEDTHPDAPLTIGGHKRLVLKSQSNYGRIGVTRSTINAAAEAAAKEDRAKKEQEQVWRFALRQRIARVLKETGGSLRQIAVIGGVLYKSLHTFMQTGREMRRQRLMVVAEAMDKIERGELELRNMHGAHLLSAARLARIPSDCVCYKEFVQAVAQLRGVKVHAQYQYFSLNPETLPPRVRLNQRLVYIKRSDMEAALTHLRLFGFEDKRVRRTGRAKARTTNMEVAA